MSGSYIGTIAEGFRTLITGLRVTGNAIHSNQPLDDSVSIGIDACSEVTISRNRYFRNPE